MRVLGITLASLAFLLLLIAGGGVFLFYHYGRHLPDHKQLAAYEPSTVTRVHAGDGRLIAEYATEKRVFVPLKAMPKLLIQAFLSAEDKNFYEHFGVDPISIAGALIKNVSHIGGDRRLVGASTITQQVAKNFLLTNEPTFSRKFKEAILAIRIEDAFSKDRILELYLNEIYLGMGSYGVAAAALNYFNKSLDELTVAEMAFLAALPKAPNNYNPIRHHDAAVARRDWVLTRLAEDGHITQHQADLAMLEPLKVQQRDETEFVEAAYFTEEVRRWLYDRFGEKQLYEGGLSVRTTIDPKLQEMADRNLRAGLIAYDRRHGWRGPLANFEPDDTWIARLRDIVPPAAPDSWKIAIVRALHKKGADIALTDGRPGVIPLDELTWARKQLEGRRLGPKITRASDVLKVGDIVFVKPLPPYGADGRVYSLQQIPEVSGALVAIDPHNGRVLAMSGGFEFALSQFNRVTQAERQPGSAFKPFVYLAALDSGMTPASIVLDAPMVLDQGAGLGKWKPENYTQRFYGPGTLRRGLEKSRNLMTVRVSQQIGMDKIVDYARRFGINPNLPNMPAMALGAGETTLLKLTTAYAMLVNGGKRIKPALIERIQDRNGKTIYRRDNRECPKCTASNPDLEKPPHLPDDREQVADPTTAYQIVSMLEGVVQRGTGRTVASVGKPLAGKTGTTNDYRDAWFIGFSPDLAVGVYVGFDKPKSLGRRESGGRVAAPIFRDFMKDALANKPAVPFRVPPGIRFVRIDADTGLLAEPNTRDTIVEAFRVGTEPTESGQALLDEQGGAAPADAAFTEGVGGLY